MKEYLTKIQNMCAFIEGSDHQVSEAEHVEVILTGLSSDYDTVVTSTLFSSEPLPL